MRVYFVVTEWESAFFPPFSDILIWKFGPSFGSWGAERAGFSVPCERGWCWVVAPSRTNAGWKKTTSDSEPGMGASVFCDW